jgi:pimeloyl-ACP methyl ester carboxylesterase
MAVRRSGRGPDVVLFHGGMGSWRHWTRNIEPLAARFTVHALDHPSYGASAAVPRETSGADYLDLVHRLFVEMFPGEAPLRFAGFSFGAAIAATLARRLAKRVTHLCLVSPAGFPARSFGERPTRSYREAGDDEALFREICRHNLLINMLSDPASHHGGDAGHPGRLRPPHPLQQPQGERRRDPARRPRSAQMQDPPPVGRGATTRSSVPPIS